MSDDTPATKKPRTTKPATTPFERAVTGDEGSPVEESPEVEERVEDTRLETSPPETSAPEPAAEPAAGPAATVGAQPQVIYVSEPAAPARKGNRGFGVAAALVSAVLFGVLLALAVALIGFFIGGVFDFAFLGRPAFYAPVLLFAVGFILVALIANRANWWAYIVGSVLIGLFVYFGTAAVGMLSAGVIQNPGESADIFANQLVQPFVIVSGLLAREVSMWAGVAISRRGRAVKARNADAYAAYERDRDEKRAERERVTGVPA